MFGYIQPDIPYTYVKDGILYKALYCGLCKSIGRACGQCARAGLSSDMTFLSALLHNIMNVDVKIEKQHCILHPFVKRPMAEDDGITRAIACLNTAFTYYKLTDDIEDEHKGRFTRSFFKKGFRRANALYPQIGEIIKKHLHDLQKLERQNCSCLDAAADPFGLMIAELSDECLKEFATDDTHALCYGIGKWVYLVDALDDYDKDKKKGRYNPFALSYGSESKEKLLKEHGEDIAFLFDTLFYGLREDLANIKFYFNRDLTDNVLLRGIPIETERVMRGEKPVKMQVDLK